MFHCQARSYTVGLSLIALLRFSYALARTKVKKRLDILDLKRLGRVRQHDVCGAQARGRRRGGVHHDLQHGRVYGQNSVPAKRSCRPNSDEIVNGILPTTLLGVCVS